MAVKRKRLGIGSLAFVLMALGVLIAFTFKGRCIGDAVLDAVGLRACPRVRGGYTTRCFIH